MEQTIIGQIERECVGLVAQKVISTFFKILGPVLSKWRSEPTMKQSIYHPDVHREDDSMLHTSLAAIGFIVIVYRR
jgi:hypothetical protein